MQKIKPFLWFDGQAEEAAEFYTSIFRNSNITGISRYTEAGPRPAGSAMVVEFTLDGEEFAALNGGPIYQFTPAISFTVDCETQEEVDDYWEKLCEGGKPIQCGWLEDKFGLSWQIVPTMLTRSMKSGDPEKVSRMVQAMMKMIKLDIAELQRAYDGE